MNGRIEHGLKIDQKTKEKLDSLPNCVTDYYYHIAISTEPHTRKEYVLKLESFLKHVCKPIEDITEKDIVKYFYDINHESETKKKKQLSSSYQQLIWTSLNRFFQYAENEGIIRSNPMKYCDYPKSKDQHKKVFLKPDELHDVLSNIQKNNTREKKTTGDTWEEKFKERNLLIMYLLMNTGMRSEMLCEINVEDLDYDKMKLTVVGKGRKEMEYKITPKMCVYINQWMTKRIQYIKNDKQNALFINRNGERITYSCVHNVVKKFTDRIGKEVTPHKLRASFITNFYEASGHDLEATRIAGGHEHIETTKKYIGGKEKSRFDAQKYMDQIL